MVTWLKKHYIEIILISLLFTVGFYFRLKGISSNQSFWSDEAYTSSIARDIVIGKISFKEGINVLGYQRMQIISNYISFKLFGISEESARIPSVVWGSIGIIFAFLLAKKHSNIYGGMLAAFLFTFLQINIAHSTQAKPFAAIETLILVILYIVERSILLSIVLAIIAALYNYIGLVAFIPIIINIGKNYKKIINKPLHIFFIFMTIFVLAYILRIDKVISLFLRTNYNWLTYLRELFWRQYGFLTLPAIFGLFLIKDKKTFWSVFLILFSILFSWNFIGYSRNLRYLLPVFGIIVVLFGIFWGKIGEIIFNKSLLVCGSVALIIFLGGYKVARKPSIYYTPNADFFADVQNADYKQFFRQIYTKFPDFDNNIVFADTYDYMSWYSTKVPNAIFAKSDLKSWSYPYINVPAYSSLSQFKEEIITNQKGFLIVEDWQSFTPDDIKEFAKNSLKLEIRIESMEVSPNDKWPLELYSWGMENKLK